MPLPDLTMFRPVGSRVACAVCGRVGYPGGRWQDPCRAGHPYSCRCGRRFTTRSGLSAHLLPRRPGARPQPEEAGHGPA